MLSSSRKPTPDITPSTAIIRRVKRASRQPPAFQWRFAKSVKRAQRQAKARRGQPCRTGWVTHEKPACWISPS